MRSRRQAREVALQIGFQREFSKGQNAEVDLQASLQFFRSHFPTEEETWKYAEKLVHGVAHKQNDIDSLIRGRSLHWKQERMSLVDLNILRIAVYEICFSEGEIPPKVAVDEAVEMAKKYGTSDSAKFINGILDSFVKEQLG